MGVARYRWDEATGPTRPAGTLYARELVVDTGDATRSLLRSEGWPAYSIRGQRADMELVEGALNAYEPMVATLERIAAKVLSTGPHSPADQCQCSQHQARRVLAEIGRGR